MHQKVESPEKNQWAPAAGWRRRKEIPRERGRERDGAQSKGLKIAVQARGNTLTRKKRPAVEGGRSPRSQTGKSLVQKGGDGRRRIEA